MDKLTAFSWEIEIRRRRDIILNYMLMTGAFGGGLGLVLLFIPPTTDPMGRLADTMPFLVIWLIALGVWLFRNRLNYQIRTWMLLLLVYSMGCYLLFDGGLTGSGRIWLLLGPTVAVVMLDVWPGGVLAGVSSILIYIFFALFISFGVLQQRSGVPTDLGFWITEGGDFLIAVAGLVLGMWGFRSGWLEALQKTGTINQQLEGTMRDLQSLNAELDTRVIDRTQQLAGALARNEAVLAGIADGVIVVDLRGEVITTNPAMGNLLGRSINTILGQTVESLMGRDVAEADREMVGRLLRDGEITWSGFKFRWGDKMLAASIAPVHSDTGMVTGMVAVFRDFTREAEIDQMKSLFVSIASHDLRTPLNSILGYAEMLYEGIYGELVDEQREIVARVIANTQHMLGLANNLLDRAQIEAGTLTFNYSSLSPSELVIDVLNVMEVLARTQGLAISSVIADDVPERLSSDRQRLTQILVNLVGNAIKYTDEGEVQVRVYMVTASKWALEVSDTGRGISRDDQAHVFEPFRRASGLPGYGGSGLGLSIVKRLVEMMGGEIRLRSEVGQGSTFTVVLPLRPV